MFICKRGEMERGMNKRDTLNFNAYNNSIFLLIIILKKDTLQFIIKLI